MISPEDILASQGAGLDRAVSAYGQGPIDVASLLLANEVKHQSDLAHLQAAGDIQRRNELALQAARHQSELEQIGKRYSAEQAMKTFLLPLEHQNRMDETTAAAKAHAQAILSMDQAREDSTLRQSGIAPKQAGETDAQFADRLAKQMSQNANKWISAANDYNRAAESGLASAVNGAREKLLNAAKQNLKQELNDKSLSALIDAGTPVEKVIADISNQKKRENAQASWASAVAGIDEMARKQISPDVVKRYEDLKRTASEHLDIARDMLKRKAAAGAEPDPVPADIFSGASAVPSTGDIVSRITPKVATTAAPTPKSASADDVFNLPGASGLGAFPGTLKQAGSAALDAIGSIMFPRSNAPTPSPGQIPPGLIINTAPPPPFALEPIDPNLILKTPSYVRPYEY